MVGGKKVALITGVTGFTGKYMEMELLKAGYVVYGFTTRPSKSPMYFQVNLDNVTLMAEIFRNIQPDLILHLAAQAFVAGDDPLEFYHSNTIGTGNLFTAIETSQVQPDSILISSSANVYGNNGASESLTESSIVKPVNDYAISKLAMEYVCDLWREKFPIIVTRPFNYTGLSQKENFLIPKIVRHHKSRSNSISLGNTDVYRDFCDVRDVVLAYRLLMEQKKSINGVVNICSEKVYSLLDILNMCEEVTGHTLTVSVNEKFVRDNEVKLLKGSNEYLHSLINGWDPRPLKITLKWMLSA